MGKEAVWAGALGCVLAHLGAVAHWVEPVLKELHSNNRCRGSYAGKLRGWGCWHGQACRTRHWVGVYGDLLLNTACITTPGHSPRLPCCTAASGTAAAYRVIADTYVVGHVAIVPAGAFAGLQAK